MFKIKILPPPKQIYTGMRHASDKFQVWKSIGKKSSQIGKLLLIKGVKSPQQKK